MDIRSKGDAALSAREKVEVEEPDAAEAGTRAKRSSEEAAEKLSPEVRNLIEDGKKRGFVTYDELNKVLPADMVSPEKLDMILQVMDDLGIEMVETAAEGGAAEKETPGFEAEDESQPWTDLPLAIRNARRVYQSKWA